MGSNSETEWFAVRRFPHAVTMIREPHHDWDVKSYLVEGSRDVAVLDTGLGAGDFAGLVSELSSKRPRGLQTHAHWDHIGASHRFADVRVHVAEAGMLRAGWPAYRYAEGFTAQEVAPGNLPASFDAKHGIPGTEPTGWLEHGDLIDLGDRVLEVLHTPGHSPGSVSLLDREARAIFVGDLLCVDWMYLFFPPGDLSYGSSDPAAFRESLRIVAGYLDQVDFIFPTHGPAPVTPADVVAIREAFEEVWAGRSPDGRGDAIGYPVVFHDFGRFVFLLAPDARLGDEGMGGSANG